MIGKQYEYEAMARCENKLWWYRCLHELTLKKIKQVADKNANILDAGCGTGGLLARLESQGFVNISGFDLSKDAIDYTIKNGFSNVRLLNILDSDKAYSSNSFDVIVCNDILCLLNEGDDKVAFEKLVSLLKPGGSLIMNLPASKYFRGTHDQAVGIKIRYSKEKVLQLAEDTDVQISETNYWPFILSPLILSVRLLQRGKLFFSKEKQYKSDVRLPHPVLNSLFYNVTNLEKRWTGSRAWGSSIFITAVKK